MTYLKYNDVNNECSSSSRYKALRVINEIDLKDSYRYLEMFNNVSIPVRVDDLYHVVTPDEEGRLDIISNRYFGTPTYWWAIAIANGYIDPFAVKPGTMVRIPSLAEVSDVDNEILTRRGR